MVCCFRKFAPRTKVSVDIFLAQQKICQQKSTRQFFQCLDSGGWPWNLPYGELRRLFTKLRRNFTKLRRNSPHSKMQKTRKSWNHTVMYCVFIWKALLMSTKTNLHKATPRKLDKALGSSFPSCKVIKYALQSEVGGGCTDRHHFLHKGSLWA